jgi:hypothetical protein
MRERAERAPLSASNAEKVVAKSLQLDIGEMYDNRGEQASSGNFKLMSVRFKAFDFL